MAEIPDTAEFVITTEDSVQFNTRTNGDVIRISGVHLSADNAAALAYLINAGVALKVEIKQNT